MRVILSLCISMHHRLHKSIEMRVNELNAKSAACLFLSSICLSPFIIPTYLKYNCIRYPLSSNFQCRYYYLTSTPSFSETLPFDLVSSPNLFLIISLSKFTNGVTESGKFFKSVCTELPHFVISFSPITFHIYFNV